MRPVPAGKSVRMSFSRQKEVLEMPNLIEIQKDSYQWFLDEGLKEVFDDISPIADFAGHLSLEFVDFTLCKDDIKYTIEECKERDATYAAPLKVKVRLCNKDKDEINEHEIFMGDLPLMTDTGSFVINGAERVIVSQLVRSPGIYYGIDHDKIGKELYSCTVIPNRGAWLEYETDSNDVFYVRVDRTRKVPVTVLIRALGYGTNAEIIDLFGEEPKLLASFGKDTSDNYQDGLLELYKKIRPGEPLSVDSAESLLNGMFFDPRRYDLAKVGRYKFNKKLHMKNRIVGQIPSEDIVDTSTGEILAEAGKAITKDQAIAIQNAAIPYVWIQTEERVEKVLSNLMVDLSAYVTFNPEEVGITELVYYPVLKEILEKAGDDEEELKAELDSLTTQNNKLIQDQGEYQRLKELYNLDQTYEDYPKVAATIISKDPGNWYDTFMINRGSADGIRVDNNVIADKGLVGIVTEVGTHWATVRSIIDDSSNVSAMTVSTQDNCVVEGDLELIDEGKLSFSQMYDQDNKVTVGERIVTSNISEKYVEGLFIGYVSEVRQDSNNLTKTGTIVTPVDFQHLKDVLVITVNKQDSVDDSGQAAQEATANEE